MHKPEHPAVQSNVMRNITLLLLSTLTIMSGTVVSPSLPGMVVYFGSEPHISLFAQLILTIPAISIAASAPFVGILADRIGRRKLLLICVLVYGLAGSAGLYLNSIASLLVSRVILGVAVAGIMVNTTTLVGDYFIGQGRIQFMGYRSTAVSVGGIVFLVGSGFLAELGWRAPFLIYLLALLILLPAFKWISEPDMASFAPDPDAPTHNILQEHLRHVHLYFIGMAHFIAFYYVFTQIPFRMPEIGESSSIKLGIVLGTVTAFGAIFSAIYPLLHRFLAGYMVFITAFVCIAIGYFCASMAMSFNGLIVSMAFVGAGSGLLLPNLSASAVSQATPHMRGRVAGIMSASVFAGQFLSPLITFPLVSRFSGQSTFAILAVCYTVSSAFLAFVVYRRWARS